MTTIEKKNIIWLYLISFLFLLANSIFFITTQNYYFCLLPIFLLIVLFAVFALDKLLLFVVLFTPISIQISELIKHVEFDLSLPTEPILFGISLIFIFKLLLENNYDKKILTHPISIAIYVNLAWIFITALTSSMPLVSIKFFISRCWFVIPFYFLTIQLFRKYHTIHKYIWLYVASFILVIAYTIIRQAQHGLLNHKVANYMSNPFYNDHTSYGAILAMLLPVLIGFTFLPPKYVFNKLFSIILIPVFIFAIIFSYTRATWLSLFGAFIIFIIIIFRIRFYNILLFMMIAGVVLWVYRTDIIIKIERNKTESSTDIIKHAQSISNIRSDASNMERVNRWKCALRMVYQYPIFGWGPGTYMFQYAPFQMSYEKTIISTNSGDVGNAHSEYLGPLAESGIPGFLSFVAIVVLVIYTGIKLYYKLSNRQYKIMVISALIGLITYFIHGFLNNFLDTDKASALFWGFIAIIVAIQLFHQDTKTDVPPIEEKK